MAPTQGVKTITTNVGWSVLSKTATFGLKFVTVPILARLLTPEDFGTVAVALTVVQFLAMIGGAGLTSALIVDRDSGMDTVHTVFWANLEYFLNLLQSIDAASRVVAENARDGHRDNICILSMVIIRLHNTLCFMARYALVAVQRSYRNICVNGMSGRDGMCRLQICETRAGRTQS